MADRLGPPDAGVKERIPMRSMKHQPARYLWPAAMLGAVAALQPASAAPADARSAAAVTVSSSSISRPQGIAAGPDGALWFTNQGTNSIGRITTSGAVSAFTGPGISLPEGITKGSDGALWFTNYGNDSIGRLSASGTVTHYTATAPRGAAGAGPAAAGPARSANCDHSATRRIDTSPPTRAYTA